MATPDRDEPTPQNESHTTREREVIVTDNGSRSYGGLIVAILAIVVFGVLGYLFLGAMGGDGGGDAAPVPDEVNVDVEGGTDGG